MTRRQLSERHDDFGFTVSPQTFSPKAAMRRKRANITAMLKPRDRLACRRAGCRTRRRIARPNIAAYGQRKRSYGRFRF